jgi:hypothetical protein
MEEFRGRWALVTGASSGIGVSLARALGAAGAKLVLTARRKERLEALAAELAARGVECRVVVADLNDPEAPAQIFAAVSDLQVDILVNNAGLGQYGAFAAAPAEQEFSQIRVNCEAMVRLTRLFLPPMVERKQGWILILASTASLQPVPYLATYAASKAFDRYFAQALAAEVKGHGVRVTALCPGPTESEFFRVARASVFRGRSIQSADVVARRALAALHQGKGLVIPYLQGRILALLVRLLPTGLITRVVERAARPEG